MFCVAFSTSVLALKAAHCYERSHTLGHDLWRLAFDASDGRASTCEFLCAASVCLFRVRSRHIFIHAVVDSETCFSIRSYFPFQAVLGGQRACPWIPVGVGLTRLLKPPIATPTVSGTPPSDLTVRLAQRAAQWVQCNRQTGRAPTVLLKWAWRPRQRWWCGTFSGIARRTLHTQCWGSCLQLWQRA